MGISAIDETLSVQLGRGLAAAVAARPGVVLGNPRPLVDPGRPLAVTGSAASVLATGFGLDQHLLAGDPATILDRLRTTPVTLPSHPVQAGSELAAGLAATLQTTVERLVGGIATLPAGNEAQL
jgi:hypothetical protein